MKTTWKFEQIQIDLLNPDASLSTVLRKARVLASQLKSKELQGWVEQELEGYKTETACRL